MSSLTKPLVSVILPVHNGQSYVLEAVQSILAQSYTNFELIIVNDGSTDDTLKILSTLKDSRIRIIDQEKQGIVESLNNAIITAKGDLLVRMDADDISLPTRLAHQVKWLIDRPNDIALGTAAILIGPTGHDLGRTIQPPIIHAEILKSMMYGGIGLLHPTVMMRADSVRAVGCYRSRFTAAEDIDLWLRLAEIGQLASLNEALLKMRVHSASMSRQKVDQQLVCGMAARLAFLARKHDFPDPADDCDEVWKKFTSNISDILYEFNVFESRQNHNLALSRWSSDSDTISLVGIRGRYRQYRLRLGSQLVKWRWRRAFRRLKSRLISNGNLEVAG
jgi:glycosyltransferase involved in cell wall biosynthesis